MFTACVEQWIIYKIIMDSLPQTAYGNNRYTGLGTGVRSSRIVMICIIHCIAGWLIVAEKTSGIHCPKEPLEVMLLGELALVAE